MFTNKHYILTICEEGSFSKAAERLYISQPSLSASVKRIEEKVSVPLFDRSTTPVTLTEAGREYVKYALEISEKEHNFERYISDYTGILTGTVRIGGSSLFSSFLLPGMISEFKKEYPYVSFEIFEDSSKNLIQKLMAGILDIIIDNAVINNDIISSIVCMEENLLLAVPCGFEVNDKLGKFRLSVKDVKSEKHLSEKYNVSLECFKGCPFILLNPENDTGRRAKLLLAKYGLASEGSFFLDQQVTAYNICCTGMGVTFVSDTLVKHTQAESGMYFYKLSDNEAKRNIYFYKKNNHYLSHACQRFIDFGTTI